MDKKTKKYCYDDLPKEISPVVFVCSGCGRDIIESENYWDVLGEQFCQSCIREAKGVARYDPN